jgi:hypothetical protein
MPFCPRCGLNMAELAEDSASVEGLAGGRSEAPAWTPDATFDVASDATLAATRDPARDEASILPSASPAADASLPSGPRGLAIPPIVIAAVFVMIGLIAFGLLTRSQPGAILGPGGQETPGPSVVVPPPPIVGLSILSPTDGQAVAAPEVTVIGTAPPGVSITQDISLGLDQHSTSDGTGHWAIKVGLNEGDNKLTFRIGDDRSTEKSIRVTYTPSRTP